MIIIPNPSPKVARGAGHGHGCYLDDDGVPAGRMWGLHCRRNHVWPVITGNWALTNMG